MSVFSVCGCGFRFCVWLVFFFLFCFVFKIPIGYSNEHTICILSSTKNIGTGKPRNALLK